MLSLLVMSLFSIGCPNLAGTYECVMGRLPPDNIDKLVITQTTSGGHTVYAQDWRDENEFEEMIADGKPRPLKYLPEEVEAWTCKGDALHMVGWRTPDTFAWIESTWKMVGNELHHDYVFLPIPGTDLGRVAKKRVCKRLSN